MKEFWTAPTVSHEASPYSYFVRSTSKGKGKKNLSGSVINLRQIETLYTVQNAAGQKGRKSNQYAAIL